MSIVSSCPECAKPVLLPEAAPEARVRCPNCSAEYELRRALDLVPQMLQVLDEPSPFGNGFAAAPALNTAAAEHHDITESIDEVLEFGEPLTSREESDESNDEPDTEVEGSPPLIDELLAEPADLPEIPFDLPPDADLFDSDQLDLGESLDAEAPSAVTGPEHSEEIGVEEPEVPHASRFAPGDPVISPVSSALKRRKREPSLIGNLIGVVGGGVVGCSLAYFIVLWIGGPEKDFLEIAPKLPKWILPSTFSAPAPTATTPMATNPTPTDLAEVQQAARPEAKPDEPLLKINVPELPDKPTDGTDLANSDNLPFNSEKQPPSADDMAAELHDDRGIGGAAITPPDAGAAPKETRPAPPFKQPVSYTAADLEKVLSDVKQLAAQATEGKPTRKQLMSYYLKLYRLGEVATFATDADPARQQVLVLLATLAANPEKLPEIGRNGAGFFGLDPTRQGDDKGVLLAGDVESSEAVGDLHRITLMPIGGKHTISIYSAKDPGLRQGSTVLILGSIVNDPKAALNGFTGNEPKIVWLGASVIANK